jgi:hypothetical protein
VPPRKRFDELNLRGWPAGVLREQSAARPDGAEGVAHLTTG